MAASGGGVVVLAYRRVAAIAAIGVGIGGVLFSIAFMIYLSDEPRWSQYAQSILLLAGGILALVVYVALYELLRDVDPGYALLALLLGVAGAFGTAAHGAFDLANLVETPSETLEGVPSPTDPRGLATFLLTGLSIALFSWLGLRAAAFPRALGYLGLAAGLLLAWVFLGRLIILDPENLAVLIPAAAVGFVANPAWFGWLGLVLGGRRSDSPLPGDRSSALGAGASGVDEDASVGAGAGALAGAGDARLDEEPLAVDDDRSAERNPPHQEP